MLDATESKAKGNDNFAVDVENAEKNVEEVRRKNQTYFFSKSLGDLLTSYLLWKYIMLLKFSPIMYIEWFI